MRRHILAVVVITGVISIALTTPASATYVGREGKIAFVRANQIYTVAGKGGAVTKLTTSGKNYRPKWSPDGKRIAYINELVNGTRDVWVMSATGGSKTRVTTVGNVTTNPTWTANGRQIYFGAGTGIFGSPVWYVSANKPFGSPIALLGQYFGCESCDETVVQQLQADRFLAWSPDGKSLAIFNGYDARVDHIIYLYRPATGVAEAFQLFQDHEAVPSDLVFGVTGQLGFALLVVDPEPAQAVISYPGFAWVDGDHGPAPSPTNAHMALSNNASGTANIYTTTTTGAQRRMIVANGYQPDWQSLH